MAVRLYRYDADGPKWLRSLHLNGDGRAAARLMQQHLDSVERNLRLDPRSPDLAAVLRPLKR